MLRQLGSLAGDTHRILSKRTDCRFFTSATNDFIQVFIIFVLLIEIDLFCFGPSSLGEPQGQLPVIKPVVY